MSTPAADLTLLAHRAESVRALANTVHALLLAGERADFEPLASPRNLQGLLAALADLAGEIEAATGRLADAETLGRLRWMPTNAAEEAQP